MAPILSFTAEQISDHYQKDKTESIHLQQFPVIRQKFKENLAQKETIWPEDSYSIGSLVHFSTNMKRCKKLDRDMLTKMMGILKDVRSALLKAIELEREKQID